MDTNPVKSIPITQKISVGSQRKQLGCRIDAAIQTGDGHLWGSPDLHTQTAHPQFRMNSCYITLDEVWSLVDTRTIKHLTMFHSASRTAVWNILLRPTIFACFRFCILEVLNIFDLVYQKRKRVHLVKNIKNDIKNCYIEVHWQLRHINPQGHKPVVNSQVL